MNAHHARSTGVVLAALSLGVAACDGHIQDEAGDSGAGTCLSACDPPRVPDCIRLAPEATPLARISPDGDRERIARDGDGILFISDGRVMRLPMAKGLAVPVTPPGMLDGGIDVRPAPGGVVWSTATAIRAYSHSTNEARTLLDIPEGEHAAFAVVGSDLVVAIVGDGPTQVGRLAFGGGALEPIATFPVWDHASANVFDEGSDDDALLIFGQKLHRVALDGSGSMVVGADRGSNITLDAGFIYGDGLGVSRTPRAGGPTATLTHDLLATFNVVNDANDIFALAVAPSDVDDGKLVRISKTTGVVTPMATVDLYPFGAPVPNGLRPVTIGTAGLVVDDQFVYFTQACGDDDPHAYRIVRLPKDASM
jgi:hypothetical protein